MLIYKCDKCGKLIKEDPGDPGLGEAYYHVSIEVKKGERTSFGIGNAAYITVCNKCFAEWATVALSTFYFSIDDREQDPRLSTMKSWD